MRAFALRQGIWLVAGVLGLGIVLFVLLDLIPNAPADADAPAVLRLLSLFGGLVTGDFGVSASQHSPVGKLIAERLSVTLPLALFALLVAGIVGVPLALVAGRRRGSALDRGLGAIGAVLAPLPAFWLGMLLSLLLASTLRWLPSGGFVPWSGSPLAALSSLVLPALSLGLPAAGLLALDLRLAYAQGLEQSKLRELRSAGLTTTEAGWRLGSRQALGALPRLVASLLASLLIGAALVESVFYLPGLGRQILGAVAQHDLVLLRGSLFVLLVIAAVLKFALLMLEALARPAGDTR